MKTANWIPVKISLPAKFKKVLVFTNGGDFQITSVDDSGEFDNYPLRENEQITHWTDLPERPVKLSKRKIQKRIY